jgi:hypothetical protein
VPLVDHLLQALRTLDGSRTALARSLGLSRQRVGRVLRGVGYPLGPENCVRLALMNDADPADVLEAAGHDRFAELLREAYGDGPTVGLTPRQRSLVREWTSLSKADQKIVDDLLKRLASTSNNRAAKPPRKTKKSR